VAALSEENSAAAEEVSAGVRRRGASAVMQEAAHELAKMAKEVEEQAGRFRI
jgi:methyl-accepting chemotaxis protein